MILTPAMFSYVYPQHLFSCVTTRGKFNNSCFNVIHCVSVPSVHREEAVDI